MLVDKDIEYMRSSREEIREKRTRKIKITGRELLHYNPITDEKEYGEIEYTVDAVISEVSVRTSVDRYMEQGIEIFTGDLIVDVSLIDMPELENEDIKYITHRDVKYTAITADTLGLGEDNRVEIIGRRTK